MKAVFVSSGEAVTVQQLQAHGLTFLFECPPHKWKQLPVEEHTSVTGFSGLDRKKDASFFQGSILFHSGGTRKDGHFPFV